MSQDKARHTPGPWFMKFGKDPYADCHEWAIGPAYSNHPNGLALKQQVARVSTCCGPEMIKNAELVQAAPQLLEALVLVRRKYHSFLNAEDMGLIERAIMIAGDELEQLPADPNPAENPIINPQTNA